MDMILAMRTEKKKKKGFSTYGSTQFYDTDISWAWFSIYRFVGHPLYPLLNSIRDMRDNLKGEKQHNKILRPKHGKTKKTQKNNFVLSLKKKKK